MSAIVLVLRPEPGASASAARAGSLGLEAVKAPLFVVRPLAWRAPDPARVDAVLLTSANAARHAGPALAEYVHLPCHAVGEATAAAAADAGFQDVRCGDGDGTAALAGVRAARILHLCGRDHVPLEREGIEIERLAVYSAEAVAALPAEGRAALRRGALALIHSPRSGALFARLVDADGLPRTGIALAAISAPAAAAAGGGWRSVAAAGRPRDEALLELARELCQTGGPVRE